MVATHEANPLVVVRRIVVRHPEGMHLRICSLIAQQAIQFEAQIGRHRPAIGRHRRLEASPPPLPTPWAVRRLCPSFSPATGLDGYLQPARKDQFVRRESGLSGAGE